MMPCRSKLMKTIQTLSFAVHETVLYLDGHPNDRRALSYFTDQNEKLRQAVNMYETNFGPLTANGFDGGDEWTWITSPWPWKFEANTVAE